MNDAGAAEAREAAPVGAREAAPVGAREAAPDGARIFEQGYRAFTGPLASPSTRFVVIARNELRQAWKDKWFRRLILAAFMPLLIIAAVAVFMSRFAALAGTPQFEVWRYFWNSQLFFTVLVVYFVGRNALGEDLRSGALTIYFSRPVSFRQYLGGKWLAIAIGIGFVTVVPGALLGLVLLLSDPATHVLDFLARLGVLLVLGLLLCLCQGWVMLGLSSLVRRGRTAGILWLGLLFVLPAVATGLVESTGQGALAAVSFFQASQGLEGLLCEGKGNFIEGLWFVLGQLAWSALGAAVVLLRLRRWVRS